MEKPKEDIDPEHQVPAEEVAEAAVQETDNDENKSYADYDVKFVHEDGKGKEDEECDNADLYPVREVRFNFIGDTPVSFNPVVSIIGIVCLWGLSAWCMADPEGSNEVLGEWRGKVTHYFTWIFVGSKCVFFFFLLWIAFKFGHIKLGQKDEPPEFSTAAYFSMIFAAGVAVGLFIYGVSEPLIHQSGHYYASSGFHTQDEVDMWAINLTATHWNIAGWAPYLIVAISMGLAGHRFKLPMTFRACFYPILGEYTWGWIGDVIDGFTIVVTVAGVCTSLGLGAVQIVDGLQYLGWADKDQEGVGLEVTSIWVITAVATASVISGLDAGIKFLSLVAFNLGLLLQFMVFVSDDTKFIMNLVVQEIGYFFQYSIFLLNFRTGAFAQLEEGQGHAIDGLAETQQWQNWWPIFYQAWWVSWSAFVGLFVARISRGRTVGEVILYSMVAPSLYCTLWFCVWGGVGIRQARQALELQQLGLNNFGNMEYFQSDVRDECYDVPQNDVTVNNTVIFSNKLMGVTPVCLFASSGDAPFNVLHSFSHPDSFSTGSGQFLSVLFIIALAIYFATSSDSGSLVVDFLASNGRLHHHWVQRLFWALTEGTIAILCLGLSQHFLGAVATALLSAGADKALQSVQAASIIAGLPFLFLICYLVQSIYLFCVEADKTDEVAPFAITRSQCVFNIMEYILSLGVVHPARAELGMDKPKPSHYTEFAKGLFVPSVSLLQILNQAYPNNRTTNAISSVVYGILYYSWIAIFATLGKYKGLKPWGWLCFFAAAFVLMAIRNGFRTRYNIRSNELADAITSLFFWPQVLSQMQHYCSEKQITGESEEKYI